MFPRARTSVKTHRARLYACAHVRAVVDYDPRWPSLYAEEVERLRPVFGDDAAFEHVGSTAIPGLAAKPVIDILVGLRSVDLTRKQEAALRRLGYVSRRRDGRRYFRAGAPRTHYVHVVELDGPSWQRYLRFRELLRADAAEAAAYAELKRAAAPLGPAAYARAKAAHVTATLRRGR